MRSRPRPVARLVAAAALAWSSPLAAQPPVAREFRAAWVATVANIDWPSRPGLGSWEQQAELLRILNQAVALNLNAVILQVRPAADALYPSTIEPWSEYLTGRQGQAPEPYYDPLAFAVTEAHRRGLELHAWFNPYRARQAGARSPDAATHLSRTRPELVKPYGARLWMDPGEPAVRRHSLRVITDVVRRYDVDGVHLDDYFYPYPELAPDSTPVPFPDSASYARYVRGGGRLARGDWRRHNVDEFVRLMYAAVKREKPWVKVGISPFGIWRPGHPPQIQGFDAYDKIYADARTWLVNGWMDYFTPQLYWPVAQNPQSYPVLLRWWVGENARGRHIWPGNFTSRVGRDLGARGGWEPRELREQIRLTRAQPGATGNVHFSMKALMPSAAARPAPPSPIGRPDSATRVAALAAAAADSAARAAPSLAEQLRAGEYAERALVPASPWLSRARPPRPVALLEANHATGGTVLRIEPRTAPRGGPAGGRAARWWVVQTRDGAGGGWRTAVLPAAQRRHTLAASPAEAVPVAIAVSAVDRYGTQGPAAMVYPRGADAARQ